MKPLFSADALPKFRKRYDAAAAREVLRTRFHLESFREQQEEIIKSTLEGNDTFVIMPTGAGKSLCFQLQPFLTRQMTVVVSPLISLMQNHVQELNALGVRAATLNSTQSAADA